MQGLLRGRFFFNPERDHRLDAKNSEQGENFSCSYFIWGCRRKKNPNSDLGAKFSATYLNSLKFLPAYRAARFEGKNPFEGKDLIFGYIPASCGTRLRGGQACQAADIIFPAKSCFSLKHPILQIAGPDGNFFPKTNPEQTARSLMLWRLSEGFGDFRRLPKPFE